MSQGHSLLDIPEATMPGSARCLGAFTNPGPPAFRRKPYILGKAMTISYSPNVYHLGMAKSEGATLVYLLTYGALDLLY